MIFPLQLLGPAIGFSADPSTSKGKNQELSHNNKFFQQQTNVLIRCDFHEFEKYKCYKILRYNYLSRCLDIELQLPK